MVLELSENKDHNLDIQEVKQIAVAKKTEQKATKIVRTYLGKSSINLKHWNYLIISHYL